MLIDYTYFFGDCSIGQLSETAVQDKLNWLIQQYEPEYLEGLLGYATYRAFLEGLSTVPVPQIWLDLLNGAEYTDQYNRPKKWKGLLQIPSGSASVVSTGQAKQSIVVGRAQDAYDPINQSDTVTIPPAFVGTNFTFMQRGFGPLRYNNPAKVDDEYSISGNQLTLLNGAKFNNEETYFYFGSGAFSVNTGNSTFKISPIAYYVYCKYQKNHASSSSSTGQGVISTENSTPVNPVHAHAKAWNKMVFMNRELCDFLYVNKDNYADWYPSIFQGYGLFNAYGNNNLSKFLTTTNSLF